MVAAKSNAISDYILVLRMIQPARIQDVIRMYPEILGLEMTEDLTADIGRIHKQMRQENRLVSVRRGTYILDQQGMDIATRLIKERNLDNARMFLMKNQRKSYHKSARWSG